jgi:hypothetical protein
MPHVTNRDQRKGYVVEALMVLLLAVAAIAIYEASLEKGSR